MTKTTTVPPPPPPDRPLSTPDAHAAAKLFHPTPSLLIDVSEVLYRLSIEVVLYFFLQ